MNDLDQLVFNSHGVNLHREKIEHIKQKSRDERLRILTVIAEVKWTKINCPENICPSHRVL